MKPKLIHQEAMDFSFKAKEAFDIGDTTTSFELYIKAADLESQVAEFYIDKPELEPTRSVVIRSAAFLNIKAGLIETAQRFIFIGLLNSKDELIRKQLNTALEITISLKNETSNSASWQYSYLNVLRQKSTHYVLEPSNLEFGHSVTLAMIKDFSDLYLKSLKAYAVSRLRRIIDLKEDVQEAIEQELENLVNPLVTNSGYGSFKFSIANDFVPRQGENDEIVMLKSNVIKNYHNEIFTNPLSDEDIDNIKHKYTEEEVNEIFRPLTKMKSNSTTYNVGYYDTEEFDKIFIKKIVNKQRKQLLTVKQISKDDIGELENSIVHKRSSTSGKVSKKTIFREQLKSYELDIKTNQIDPIDNPPLILSEDIFINMNFNSNKGFTFSFDDIRLAYTDIEYNKALSGFYNKLYKRIVALANGKDFSAQDQKDWEVISKLIGNPDALKS
jgi:hypothetical protein